MGSFICKTCGKPWPLGLWDKKDEMRECDSCRDNKTIASLRAQLEEAREENERMRADGDGSEEHPFTRQFIGKCFKRHDSLLSFGVCERDDGFELTVDAVDGVRHNYAIMPDGSICDLDKLANTKAQPQTGGVDNGRDLQQALDDLRAESCPAKEDGV